MTHRTISMHTLAPAAILALTALPALAADPVFCSARIEGKEVALAYDPDEAKALAASRRERIATRLGRDECPSYVVLRALTPNLDDAERAPFCLRREDDDVLGIDLGRRDAWGACSAPSRSVCERVNAAKGAAGAITAAARGAAGGMERLPDGSGAVILSGTGGAISSALTAMGGAAATVAASPVLLTGAAASVVAVGGTVYACRNAD
ncbi:hypothetical protein Q4511_11835 [Paracoccus sp. 1_MG-2023]|uniref:hypothetical protein n=1 Tax=unclassified Paracoccus (in: a-proteobacteria) TaxID=2688777 RepID=UPI001C08664D|nr:MULTISPECIES: hypothetical protein [unclassified Paracoccus (in: a-proteobacteria)]MBU2957415.1 hypothetical protein [Paracoccus sp. C2R09]MDO6669613.1 hypothetical protein [Paracoccus sp. 1_MG-2023]